MDRLESLGSTLSQITLYDIKSMYNQAKNVVLNVSEMEAKVREATNDEPWGASSTLMQEIAQGTFSFQYFNEIMPCIYARFMEKEAKQWRQIYKALQLLEYLIKHGSERVVDDARSHVSTIKMLRNFHYIDDKGKDEGLNVRNRSRELVELLSDVEKIRTERRKAKANKHKYTGVGNDALGGMSFSSGGSRYGGFGSDSLGGGGGGSGGSSSYDRDYGGYGGGGSGAASFRDERRGGGFEEYNAGDDEVHASSPTTSRRSNSVRTPVRSNSTREAAPPPPPAPVAPVKEVNLLDGFDDDDAFSGGGGFGGLATNKALPVVAAAPAHGPSLDDDDFTDFQAAPVSTPSPPVANRNSVPANPTLMEMLSSTPIKPVAGNSFVQPAATTQRAPQTQPGAAVFGGAASSNGYGMGMGMGMGMGHRSSQSQSSFGSPLQPQQSQSMFTAIKPTSPVFSTNSATPAPPKPNATASANFDDLWSMSLGSSAKPVSTIGTGTTAGKSIKDLEKEKAMAGLWGQKPAGGSTGGAFGSFGGMGGATSSSSGGDDLLL